MLSVDEAAQSLSERFLATLQSETSVQDALLRVRLNDVARKRPGVAQSAVELHARLMDRARSALTELLGYVRRDTAFMAFADALVSAEIETLDDVKRNAATIRSRARDAAGFDVMPFLDTVPRQESNSEPIDLDRLDVETFRRLMAETIRSRLHRTPLAEVLAIARELGDPALGHDLRTSFEHLDALTLRVTAQWEPRLREAAQLYVEGKLEIPEVARLVGASAPDIAAEFERLGFARTLSTIRLSTEERLRRAEQALTRGQATEVAREVIASQRIEGIDARRHLDKP